MEVFRDMIEYSGIGTDEDYPENPVAYKQFALTKKLHVPEAKPDIESIVKIMSNAKITDARLLETPYDVKYIISGTVKQTILYVAAVPDQSVHSFHAEVPFCEMVVLGEKFVGRKHYEISAKVILEDLHAYFIDTRTIEECKVLCLILEKRYCRHHHRDFQKECDELEELDELEDNVDFEDREE